MKFLSTVYGSASGSVGGLTYSRNRGGMYARTRTIPSNPATEFQGVARENMATAVSSWTNELTPAQRTAWAAYATATPTVDALGQQLILSGQQMFIRTFTMRMLASNGAVLDGPTMSGLGNTPQFDEDPTIDASTQLISVAAFAPVVGAADTLSVYASRPVPQSRTAAHEPRRFQGSIVGDAALDKWEGDVPANWAFTIGQKVRITIVALYTDGRCSAEAFRDVVVVA